MGIGILKRYVKEMILTEEIITITRNRQQFSYDAMFDEQGDIVSAKRVEMRPEIAEAIDSIKNIMGVPQSVVYEKLKNLDAKHIQAPAMSFNQVVEEMRNNWSDTLDWPAVNRIGKGELQVKLAFRANDKVKEPDFVSADNPDLKISVKFFGDGSRHARTGESNEAITQLTKEVAEILDFRRSGKKFPQSDWSGANLISELKEMPEEDRNTAIELLTSVFQRMKEEIITEHGAAGILALDEKGKFYGITDPNEINVTTIKNSGTRIEFTGPNLSQKTMTMHRALERAASGIFDTKISNKELNIATAREKKSSEAKARREKRTATALERQATEERTIKKNVSDQKAETNADLEFERRIETILRGRRF